MSSLAIGCPEINSPDTPVDSNATVLDATPRDTGEKRGPVPKRRFQKGCFWLKKGMAYSIYYEDSKQPDGTLKTRRVRHFIGRVPDEMSERAARQEHTRIMQDVNQQRGSVAPAAKGCTFKDVADLWRANVKPHLSPSTQRQRESHLRTHILPKFANEAPHTLDAPTLRDFATGLRKVLSRKSVVQILITIFGILAHAEEKKILVSEVSLKALKLGKGEGNRTAPFFTHAQVTQIIAAAKEPYHTLFAVAWFTGARSGELMALKIKDLDFERRVIHFDETCDDNNREIRDVLKTEESTASLPMPSALKDVLWNYLKYHWKANDKGFLFPNPNGTKPRRRDNVVRYGLKPILKRLGIPSKDVGLHAFRHGLATELVESNVPLPIVQKQMRHADPTTTLRIYSHAIPATHRNVMEELGQRSIGTKCQLVQETFAN